MFKTYKQYENGGKVLIPINKGKISHMLKDGLKQSSRIIINNTKGAADRYIKRLIYDRINKYSIDEVWVYEKGNLRLLFKKQ